MFSTGQFERKIDATTASSLSVTAQVPELSTTMSVSLGIGGQCRLVDLRPATVREYAIAA